MFEQWGEFYLVAGGAAAVLIGLIFVVVTLMSDRPRSSVLSGSRLYMGPIVLHLSFVLVLTAAALAPGIAARDYALIAGALSIWGAARGIYSIAGIQRLRASEAIHWTDVWFYGVIPTLLSIALGGVVLAFWREIEWATYAAAAALTGFVLLAIRNEWDLVTWLAPKADSAEPSFEAES